MENLETGKNEQLAQSSPETGVPVSTRIAIASPKAYRQGLEQLRCAISIDYKVQIFR
jgi:hypothetical protein